MTFVMPTTREISLLTGRKPRLYFPYHIYAVSCIEGAGRRSLPSVVGSLS